MAHFAKIGLNGKVISVSRVENSVLLNPAGIEEEKRGIDFLTELHGWPIWVQTSYNTKAGKYLNADGTEGDQSKAFRGNFAGVGGTWDEENQVFWPKPPAKGYVKNLTTFQWDPPIAWPTIVTFVEEGVTYYYNITWSENLLTWVELIRNKKWNDTTKTWENL